MTEAAATTSEVAFIDDPHAPEISVSGPTGYFHYNGTLSITFESLRVDHSKAPGPVNRVVVARVVMPVLSAQNLVAELNNFLEQQGLKTAGVLGVGATRQ